MDLLTYYNHDPRKNRVHVDGAIPDEQYRRKTQLKFAELAFRSGVTDAIKNSRRWFSKSEYVNTAPQHGAFERLLNAIKGLSQYRLDSIRSVYTDDYQQFGMMFDCNKANGDGTMSRFLIRVGLFKDINHVSPNWRSVFPFHPSGWIPEDNEKHPSNNLKSLLDALSATITYSSTNTNSVYYETPEGFVYQITVVDPVV